MSFLVRYIAIFRDNLLSVTSFSTACQIITLIGYEGIKDPLLTPVIEFVFDTTMCIGKLIGAGIFNKFENLKFIFAHLGGVMPFIKERFDGIYKMLRKRNIVKDLFAMPSECLKQIYVDTSGATSHSALMCTIEMVGACPAVSYAAKRFEERCHNIIKKHFLRVAVKKTDRNHTNILFRAYAVKECCSSFTRPAKSSIKNALS